MMTPAYRRHDISDHAWKLLEPHLPARRGAWVVLPGKSPVHQRGVLDFAHRGILAGPVAL